MNREVLKDMQSRQSSANVGFRAIVMLAFVIGIPLAAFNGSSVCEGSKKLLEKLWPTISSTLSLKTADVLPAAPPYDAKAQNSPAMPGQAPSSTINPPGQLTAYNQPNLLPPRASSESSERLGLQTSNVVAADYQSEVEPRVSSAGYNSGQTEANPFMVMQDRLRQLGATYYLLETWGNQRQLYRFYCQMAVGGNSSYTHYFEATGANPLEAMADVLRQVESWRWGGNAVR
jgi:hypothetical protein